VGGKWRGGREGGRGGWKREEGALGGLGLRVGQGNVGEGYGKRARWGYGGDRMKTGTRFTKRPFTCLNASTHKGGRQAP